MQRAGPTSARSGTCPSSSGSSARPHDARRAPDYMTAHFDALDALGLGGTEWEYSVAAERVERRDRSLVARRRHRVPRWRGRHPPVRARGRGRRRHAELRRRVGDVHAHVHAVGRGTTSPRCRSRRARTPTGRSVSVTGGCYDATTVPGRMLVQAGRRRGAGVAGHRAVAPQEEKNAPPKKVAGQIGLSRLTR